MAVGARGLTTAGSLLAVALALTGCTSAAAHSSAGTPAPTPVPATSASAPSPVTSTITTTVTSTPSTSASPSPPAASTSTTSTAAPTPSSTSSGNALVRLHLVGDQWFAHSFAVTIHADGSGSALWRTYRWCSESPKPCDRMRGNEIISGGRATFTVHVPPGADYAVADVSSSTDPSVLASRGTVTITPVSTGPNAGREIVFPVRGDPHLRLCGPGASGPDCG